jgi:hypothetical protein
VGGRPTGAPGEKATPEEVGCQYGGPATGRVGAAVSWRVEHVTGHSDEVRNAKGLSTEDLVTCYVVQLVSEPTCY